MALCFASSLLRAGQTSTHTPQPVQSSGATWMLSARPGSSRERKGLLRKPGGAPATLALHLTVDSFFERGLLGIAFDPTFDASVSGTDYVYLYYTRPAGTEPVHNRVARFEVVGDTIVPSSETLILRLNNLGAGNHNGGAIHFGPDGKLYVAVGENASSSNAQTVSNLLGKMLRIDPAAYDPADPLAVIPNDNPTSFPGVAGTPTGQNKAIWSLGLRNPYTFAFQPGTGRMHINDVGQSTWEEIDNGLPGRNYGWPMTEGPNPPGNPKAKYFVNPDGEGKTADAWLAGAHGAQGSWWEH